MQHQFGLEILQDTGQGRGIADIGEIARDLLLQLRDLPQRWRGRGRQGEATQVGAKLAQPYGQPTALEAGMPGQQDAAPRPECRSQRHSCHAASPFFQ